MSYRRHLLSDVTYVVCLIGHQPVIVRPLLSDVTYSDTTTMRLYLLSASLCLSPRLLRRLVSLIEQAFHFTERLRLLVLFLI